ncbi:uncharacterized protein N7500_008756 [Penicillium coprophilum]|uniref:uncharacterized protein n=1 Tax=Penicillium coprophilum TaxID=36646 RepID=UPI00238C5396|nr:uncharacterized protein N7500_008756 [Penicillium coprophilum]KAJ5159105.1 hypothetical protein N7500_008756 [Penicillium coprophilum]
MAIIEVKPYIRGIHPAIDLIRMQRGGQVAAWICQHPPPPSELTSDPSRTFRPIISFNSEYVHYIRETFPGPNISTPLGKITPTARSQESPPGSKFLKLNEYGSFFVGNESHMVSFGLILLAFAIRECEIRDKAFEHAHNQG